MRRILFLLFALTLFVIACQPTDSTVSLLVPQPEAELFGRKPTMADFWNGLASFQIEVEDTGLPMGESETIHLENGHLWSYVHASDKSAGVVDQCGDPVGFPGCMVIYRSYDNGMSFAPEQPTICQIACNQCPCELFTDHVGGAIKNGEWFNTVADAQPVAETDWYETFAQQQYPDVKYHEESDTMFMVYEFGGSTRMRQSQDGLLWSDHANVGDTGHWRDWLKECPDYERIGNHPFVPDDYDCLSGGPPGMFIDGDTIYVFVAGGQAPSNMICWKGRVGQDPAAFKRCDNNPLFSSQATEYGPLELRGRGANPYWDFRTISSAEVHAVGEGDGRRYYMLYEGIRGPGPFDGGDTQFALGLARSLTSELDGPWETFENNPILVDLPANVGLGHADITVIDGDTILYTSLDGVVRSRLKLIWNPPEQ